LLDPFRLPLLILLAATFPLRAHAQGWPAPIPSDSLATLERTPPDVRGTLTLEEALRLALRLNPAIAESVWIARAAAHRASDEARLLNPTLDGTEENFGLGLGSGHRETTVSGSQTLEISGARGARARVASSLARVADAELDSREREVLLATAEAFLDAWSLERRLRLLRRSEDIASATVAAAKERTRVGAAPPTEGLRAQGVVAQQSVERRLVEADLAEARRRLALQWGAREAAFDSLALPPTTVPRLPPATELLADLERHPERLQAAAETAVEAARIRQARAMRIPDLTVSGGVRHLQEFGESGFVAGVSLPLPLWNSHGALVRAAEADHNAAVARETGVRLRLEQELLSAYDRLLAARDRFETARTELEPTAREALDQLQRGYRAGRFTYLDQLDGQRAAVEAELLTLQTERETWSARIALEALLGRSLESVSEGRR